MPKSKPETLVTIQRPDIQTLEFRVQGKTPLICHAWSQKARQEMLAKQMKKATGPKKAKDPKQDYHDSLYTMPGSARKYGFPAVAFKAAAVRAAKLCSDITMTDARQMFHVHADDGDLVRIHGKPQMREDPVRLNGQTADIRHRGEFREWYAVLRVDYNASMISPEQLLALFEHAGFSVGVGEWRAEKGGSFGSFTLVNEAA